MPSAVIEPLLDGSEAEAQAETSISAQKRQNQKRRVPRAQRQRIEISCDRCRQRKIRCIRTHEDEVCAARKQGGTTCESTLPRKQRIYATVDQLSVRYRILDAVVRAQFGDRDVDSQEGLLSLAEDVGAEIPTGQDGTTIQPLDPNHIDLPTKGPLPRELRPYISSHTDMLPSDIIGGGGGGGGGGGTSSSIEINDTSHLHPQTRPGIFHIPEGSLVPAPKGGYHYVGPASLAVFAKAARELVAKCNFTTLPTFDQVGLSRFLKAAEFTTFRTSQAIEARIEGHPATAAAEEDTGEGSTTGNVLDVPAPTFAAQTASQAASSPQSTLKLRRVLELLPERKLSDRLVAAFFDRVHSNYTIFHRGTFQMKYESIWTRTRTSGDRYPPRAADPNANPDPEAGWVCSLYMIYVLGAQAIEDDPQLGPAQSALLQQRFLGHVIRDGLHRLALTASLANVQALMLLSLYQHNAGERNAAWMLLGQAARTAVALGMHRDGEHSNFDPFERNTRRMCWWVLHTFEQNLSFALGRPSSTDLIDTSAILPEEMYLDAHDLPPGYFERSVALTEICSRIKRFTASVASFYTDVAHMARTCQTAEHLGAQLKAWQADLPFHLRTEYQFATRKHRRAVLLLHILCSHLVSILGRSYLLCRVNIELDHLDPARHSSATMTSTTTAVPLPFAIDTLAGSSVDAAQAAVELLISLAEHDLLEGQVWLDFYYVHHAAFIFALHFLGRPLNPSSHGDQERKATISRLLAIAQQTKLAPTYRILMNIAMQLAYVVGIGPEQEEVDQGMSSDKGSGMVGIGTTANTNTLPPLLADDQARGAYADWSHVPIQASTSAPMMPSSSSPIMPHLHHPPLAPVLPSHPNPTTYGHTLPYAAPVQHPHQNHYNALEHLFGPMPPSQHNSPPDLFADLYHFGLDTNAENPWDFFNIGVTAEGLIQGLRGLDGDGT